MSTLFLTEEEQNKPATVFLHFFKEHPEDFDVVKSEPTPVYAEVVIRHIPHNIAITVRAGQDRDGDVYVIVKNDKEGTRSRQITKGSSDTAFDLWDRADTVLVLKALQKEHRSNEEASKILMDTYGETL